MIIGVIQLTVEKSVLRVYEGFTVDFTYLIDGTHTFKAYYFVADGTQTIVTDTSEFTISHRN